MLYSFFDADIVVLFTLKLPKDVKSKNAKLEPISKPDYSNIYLEFQNKNLY